MNNRNLKLEAMRDGFGRGLVQAGEKDERVVVVTADVGESTRCHWFREKFPERFVEVGIAEQNLITVASGMTNYGKIPFVSAYAVFSPGRNWEQIRTTVALNDVPVKICGGHAGVSVGFDGGAHQALEDIAMMRALPNMTVIVPCDAEEARKAVLAAATNGKPTYIRISRAECPVITNSETPFEIGKAETYRDGGDAAIIGCGLVLYNVLLAAEELSKKGIECKVINCHTVKPLDEAAIVEAAKTGAVVTVEEHQINGGLGSAVAEVLARNCPVPQEFVAIQDKFGESGEPAQLIEKFGLGPREIVRAVERAIKRKK